MTENITEHKTNKPRRDETRGVSVYENKQAKINTEPLYNTAPTNEVRLASDTANSKLGEATPRDRPERDFERDKRLPDTLESDIEKTQERIAHSLDALTSKLQPTRIKDQAIGSLNDSLNLPGLKYLLGDLKGGVGESVLSSSQKIVKGIKQNPVSAALIGIGLGVVAVGGIVAARTDPTHSAYSKRNGSSYRKPNLNKSNSNKSNKARTYDERLRDMMTTIENKPKDMYKTDTTASILGEKLQEAKDTVRDSVSEGAHFLGEQVQSAKQIVAEGTKVVGEKLQDAKESVVENVHLAKDATLHAAKRTKEGLGHFLEAQPLVVGAVALLAGAALGLLLPRTRYEDSVMGKKSDELMSQAKVTVKDVGGAVKETVSSVMQTAKETVDEVVQTAKDTVQETVKAATA
jgi:Protein of unknown function (DUF3618)